MSSLIGKVVCTPSDPLIGESVLVQVKPATGETFDPSIEPTVRINGIPATRRHIQFIRPGENTIQVSANGPEGSMDMKSVILVVQAPPFPPRPSSPPSLLPDPGHVPLMPLPAPVESSDTWTDIGVPFLQVAHPPQQPHVVGLAVGQMPQLALHPSGAEHLRSHSICTLPSLVVPKAGEPAKYLWDFGDGSSHPSSTPYVQHDFSNSINPLVEHQSFDISVSSEGKKVTRTLTFTNLYAMLKRTRNELHPQAAASGFAKRTSTAFTGFFTVTNPETNPILLTEQCFISISPLSSVPAGPTTPQTLGTPISIPSQKLTSVSITATFAQVPKDSVGFSVYLRGTTLLGETVRINVHFDLDPSQRAHPLPLRVIPSETLNSIHDILVNGSNSGMTLSEIRSANPSSLPVIEAGRSQLSNEHHFVISGVALNPRLVPGLDVEPLHQESPVVGTECDPDNIPDNLPLGMVCQATTETRTVITPGRFMNARKGDVVLAPGGNGLIGGLLTHVDHPQYYSHNGIMTANYDQITHCTGSEGRMQDYPVGSIPFDGPEPTDGFRPDVVKYGWPGTVTQTVENSVYGETITDPEKGTLWNLQGFDASANGATVSGVWHIIPPLVVKPDPMYETDQLRQQLHTVADDSFDHTGKFHYRFYAYTDPTIERNTVTPDEGKWAKGTIPGVCSGFIWNMMKRNGMHLAGSGDFVKVSDLSPQQIAAGARIGPSTPDGLYLYTAAERARAAQWLHDQIYDQAMDLMSKKAGILGVLVEAFTKLAEHVSNEILNAFARDRVQTDDNDEGWKNTADSNAVSPDNILMWNGPRSNPPGPYGYCEPLVYREPRYDLVTVSKWRQIQLSGTLSGVVTFQGGPVGGAMITLYDGKSGGSDGQGHYSIANVPYGSYVAKAEKEQNGLFLSATSNVNLEAANATLDIQLQPPPAVFRTIVLDGTIHTHYTFHIIVKTEDKSRDVPFHRELRVGPFSTHAEAVIENDVESAHAILRFTVDWQLDTSVNVSFSFNLHDQTANNSFRVNVNASAAWNAHASANNDDANTSFTVLNALTQA